MSVDHPPLFLRWVYRKCTHTYTHTHNTVTHKAQSAMKKIPNDVIQEGKKITKKVFAFLDFFTAQKIDLIYLKNLKPLINLFPFLNDITGNLLYGTFGFVQ